MNTNKTTLAREELFEVLSSDRRRYLLYFLESNGGEADVRELAQQVAAHESGVDPSEITNEEEKRVYISLYQSHIPKLEETGLIEYDNDEKLVTSTEYVDEIANLFTEPTRPWRIYYLALAGGGTVLLLFHILGIGIASATALTVVVVGALLALSVVHFYSEKQASRQDPLSELV